jgi:GH24 family phage-related lysozyme (muramidase)
MTDDTDVFVHDLERWEGAVSHIYLDTRGRPTVGIGFLLKDVEAAVKLPFVNSAGLFATKPDVWRDWSRVVATGQTVGETPRRPASFYAAPGALHLPDYSMRMLCRDMLRREFSPRLVELLPNIWSYPTPAQRALVDLVWNLGAAGLGRFGNLLAACKARDWNTCILECAVKTSRAERNQWRAAMFEQALYAERDARTEET